MKKLTTLLVLLFVSSYSISHAQDNDWQEGFYSDEPVIFPDDAPGARDLRENDCFFKVKKDILGRAITERCFNEDNVVLIRNIAFPSLPPSLKDGFVLTVRTDEECWVNDTVLELGRDPSSLEKANALFSLKESYTYFKGNTTCEEVFQGIPDE